ncbi:hypothetical protein CP_0403 [Chlamydia pneumoniae AR39]|uniref:Uncharacterized protein n=1 Tax=Chlamydia pneumoniae TaxID=83558 RepID=Q9K283_CHLPN|nr:hypothetical protein CP_0403 [Chlamydia pneumoniae AR39]
MKSLSVRSAFFSGIVKSLPNLKGKRELFFMGFFITGNS